MQWSRYDTPSPHTQPHLHPHTLTSSQIPWGSVESVGDSSPYVTTVGSHIRNTVPVLRETLSSARKYFINFCHKFAKYVLSSEAINQCFHANPTHTVCLYRPLSLICTSVSPSVLWQLNSFSWIVTPSRPTSWSCPLWAQLSLGRLHPRTY